MAKMTEQEQRYAIYREALRRALSGDGGPELDFRHAAAFLHLSASLADRMEAEMAELMGGHDCADEGCVPMPPQPECDDARSPCWSHHVHGCGHAAVDWSECIEAREGYDEPALDPEGWPNMDREAY